jgi:hypothetical protein
MQTFYSAYQRVMGPYSTIWKWNTLVSSKITNVRSKTHYCTKSDSRALKGILHASKQEMLISLSISMQTCYSSYQRVIGPYSTIWKWNTLVSSKIENVRSKTHCRSKSYSGARKRNVDISVHFRKTSQKHIVGQKVILALWKAFCTHKNKKCWYLCQFQCKSVTKLTNGL